MENKTTETKVSSFAKALIIILIGALVGATFIIGSLYTKLQMLEKEGATDNVAAAPQANNRIVSIDDDPVLGDENAPITVIEFSDYECPFCKRYFDETFPQLIKDYVDTGKVKVVFRDFPLAFHNPMATNEAVAANCAREQEGDSKYFQYHDEIFSRTKSNGNGLTETDLTTIATDLNLDLESFNTCINDTSKTDEIKKDIADGTAAGVSGTPSFVIGKSTDDGNIDGNLIVGAQPYSAFKAVIDPLLE